MAVIHFLRLLSTRRTQTHMEQRQHNEGITDDLTIFSLFDASALANSSSIHFPDMKTGESFVDCD